MEEQRFTIEKLAPWIELEFSRSAGPGGQNVNKVNTRVAVLFDFEDYDKLSDTEKKRIRTRLSTRLSRDGHLRVISSRERSQRRNRSAAETRLIELIREAIRTRKTRRATRPTAASRQKRLKEKRERGQVKQLRQRKPTSDD